MVVVYGIKNCDTVKKSLDWFKAHQIEITFHDYKKSGIEQERLRSWCAQQGWEKFVNKKGTTWKKLNEDIKEQVTDAEIAIQVMQDHTSLIKRPVVERDDKIIAIGFNVNEYAQIFIDA